MFLFNPKNALKEQEKSAEDISRQILEASIVLNNKLSELAVVKGHLAAAKTEAESELIAFKLSLLPQKEEAKAELAVLLNSIKDVRKEKETWDVDLKAREESLKAEKQEVEAEKLVLSEKSAQYDEKLERIVKLESEAEQKLFEANAKDEKSEKERVRVSKLTKELTTKLVDFNSYVKKEETRLRKIKLEADQTLLNASQKIKEAEIRESIARDKEKLAQSQMAATADAYRRITQNGKRSV